MRRSRFGGAMGLVVAASVASAQWRHDTMILPDGLGAGDGFGASTAVWSNRVAAGAPFHLNDDGRAAGAVFANEFVGGAWGASARILAPDGADGDEFGRSVAMCCDTLLVGAPGDDDNGQSSGSVYVFTRDGPGSWTLAAKLLPADGAECDRFGWSVSLSAGVAVIGAWSDDAGCPGSHGAYVFEETGGGWVATAKLSAQAADGSEQFGHAVATSDGRVLVGAWGNDDSAGDAGALYAYEKIEGTWVVTAIHRAGDGAAGDRFGYAVGASGDVALIGAPGDDGAGDGAGSAYAFSYLNGAWSQSAKVTADDGAPGDGFGSAVDLTAMWAVVGAPAREEFGSVGKAYFFQETGGEWIQRDWSSADAGVSFGSSVAVSGNTTLVGDPGAHGAGSGSGAAHVLTTCYADFNHDGALDTRDVLAYLNAWSAGDQRADCDGCGSLNTMDFLCFFNQWTAGCE